MDYTTGDWIEYDAMTVVKGASLGTGRRLGIVASQLGRVVRIITNSPKPQLSRINVDEVHGFSRPATIKECTDRLTLCQTYGCSTNVRQALRDARQALRVRRAKGEL